MIRSATVGSFSRLSNRAAVCSAGVIVSTGDVVCREVSLPSLRGGCVGDLPGEVDQPR